MDAGIEATLRRFMNICEPHLDAKGSIGDSYRRDHKNLAETIATLNRKDALLEYAAECIAAVGTGRAGSDGWGALAALHARIKTALGQQAPQNRTTMKPTVGRIVHYQPMGQPDDRARAAIITCVHSNGSVALRVFHPVANNMDVTLDMVREAAEPTAGCWNWPPRE